MPFVPGHPVFAKYLIQTAFNLFFPFLLFLGGKYRRKTLQHNGFPLKRDGLGFALISNGLHHTKRQLIFFAAALLVGLPLFFLLKGSTGTSLAAFVMILVMLPCFLFAMYEKHGQPLETLIKNIIQTKFIRPKERPYQTENFYAVLERQRQLEKEVSAIVNGKRKTRRKQA